MNKGLLFIAAWSLVSACGLLNKLPVDLPDSGIIPAVGGGAGGGGVQSTTPPTIDTSVFTAVGGSANRLLADVGNARLEIDPTQRDALTALAQCADLVSYCYAPGVADLGTCLGRARACTTTEPWNEQPCCPEACKIAFDAEVAAGLGHVGALEKVLFRDPDCFPGARAALENP